MAQDHTNPTPNHDAALRDLDRDWGAEETYWRDTYRSRPYVTGDRAFDYYRPAYRYGYESARSTRGKQWDEIESDLASGWNRYEHRGQSTWENVKDAARDAWNRVTKR